MKAMFALLGQAAAILAIAGATLAAAAPNIPSSELPGRERERFREHPLDRFTRPGPYVAPPLWTQDQPKCKNRPAQKHKSSATKRGC